jgi:hypothetical protein
MLLRNKPFTTQRYPFQEEILNDSHHTIYCKKVSQVGLSEIMMRKTTAWLYRNQGTRAIFSLPNNMLWDSFTKTRIKPLIGSNPIFNNIPGFTEKQTRSKEVYQIGTSFLNVVVAGESSATSLDADEITIDEIDLSDPATVALFRSRLQNSDYKLYRAFSTPTYPEYGIDKLIMSSDQRRYMLKCSHCNTWQHPVWAKEFIHLPGLSDTMALNDITDVVAETLDLDSAYIKCMKCNLPLDLGDHANREWVAEHPSRADKSHGYIVSPFSTERRSVKHIVSSLLDYKRQDNLKGFLNTVVGEVDENSDTRLQEFSIRNNLHSAEDQDISRDTPIFIGSDIGVTCHITLVAAMNSKDIRVVRMFEVNQRDLEDELKVILDRYNVVGGLVDRLPFIDKANRISNISKRKINPTMYTSREHIKEVVDENFPDEAYIALNRTWALDFVAKNIRDGTLPMYGYGPHKENIVNHLRNMVREVNADKVPQWKKLDSKDHWFHSISYAVNAIKVREFRLGLHNHDSEQRSSLFIGGVSMNKVATNDRLVYSGHRNSSKGIL